MLKSNNEIAKAWQEIIARKRLEEASDRCAIKDKAKLKRMHNTWMHAWLEENLKQRPTAEIRKQEN